MMTIALLLAAAQAAPPAASIDGLPIGPLPQQTLPSRGCAAYLFSTGATRVLAATVTADTATLRLMIDGKVTDYPRTGATGVAPLGFNAETVFRGGDLMATVQMTIEPRQNLTDGAAVPSATLRLDRPGQDILVVPLAGLVGCHA